MLLLVRAGFVVSVLFLLVVAIASPQRRARLLQHFHEFFGARAGSFNLAIFRIFLFFRLARRLSGVKVKNLIDMPPALRNILPGWRWIGEDLLFNMQLAEAARWIGIVASVGATLGIFTRFLAPVAALSAVYVVGLSQFFTKVNHAGHLEMWFVLVLAFSRCGDALSIQSLLSTWRAGKPRLSLPVVPELAYELPIRICWLLFGVAYFFPGFWKLWDAGDLWITGKALLVRLDSGSALVKAIGHYPVLFALPGIGTLAFELGFTTLLLSRYRRWLAPVVGLGFHLSVWFLMGISFFATMWMYVFFVNFEWFAKKYVKNRVALEHLGVDLGAAPEGVEFRGVLKRAAPVIAAGSLLVASNIYAGIGQINSWPITVFPRFNTRIARQTAKTCDYVVLVERSNGKTHQVNPYRIKRPMTGPRWRFLIQKALKEKSELGQKQLMNAMSELIHASKMPIANGDKIGIYNQCRLPDGGFLQEEKLSSIVELPQ